MKKTQLNDVSKVTPEKTFKKNIPVLTEREYNESISRYGKEFVEELMKGFPEVLGEYIDKESERMYKLYKRNFLAKDYKEGYKNVKEVEFCNSFGFTSEYFPEELYTIGKYSKGYNNRILFNSFKTLEDALAYLEKNNVSLVE